MLDAARDAIAFANGRSRDDLQTDRMLAFALVHAIEIVGEAAARITKETQAKHGELPWSDIIGMRHRLAHGYYDINLDMVWQTVQADLPPLVSQLDRIIRSMA
jgi:uncharacterized protein with HEPN domain